MQGALGWGVLEGPEALGSGPGFRSGPQGGRVSLGLELQGVASRLRVSTQRGSNQLLTGGQLC